MNKLYFTFILSILVVSTLTLSSISFAGVRPNTRIYVEGLTLDEATAKYGVGSGREHPIIFKVNNESGVKRCGLIVALALPNKTACATGKIFYQSHKLVSNFDGTSTMRVDLYYDINQIKLIDKDLAETLGYAM
ncbi:MAG: hypothetical protein D3913_07905 [Candidatus Electrothrix sp. LOE1_4_5]|nr:hypothetical protein [Candidatus Electrothrix gigas]